METYESKIDERILKLCDIILTNEDIINFELTQKYIEEHITNNINFVNDRYTIRYNVQEQIKKYIASCSSEVEIFAFDGDGNFHRYRRRFKEYYNNKYYEINGRIDALAYPNEFEDVFNCIQESIDAYTLYQSFSVKLQSDVEERVNKIVCQSIQGAVETIEEQTDQHINNVTISIKDKVENEINKQMNDVTKNVSETSVTILGIFASIVLTIVAGLIYSSSVLNNINSANFCRLISVSALVGFVCYSLMALMFRYIERIKYKNDAMPKFNKLSIIVGSILLLIMIVFGSLQYCKFNNCSDEVDKEQTIEEVDSEIPIEENIEHESSEKGQDNDKEQEK